MGVISDYNVRVVDCGFIIKLLSSKFSKETRPFDFFKLVGSILSNME